MAIIRITDKLLNEIEGLKDTESFDGVIDGIARAFSWTTTTMQQNMVEDDRDDYINSFSVLMNLRNYHDLINWLSHAEIIEK